MFLSSLVSLVHVMGLVFAVGAATVKLVLLIMSSVDPGFLPVYQKVARPVTRQIVAGMILLTLSGIGWLIMGYGWSPRLVVKVILFGLVWVLGPVIDNVVEPRFRGLVPDPGGVASPAFIVARRQYLTLEIMATLLFYVIIVIWMFR